MSYRENVIDQRPRILRLTIEEGSRQLQEEIGRRPPPNPKEWPTNVDPRLTGNELQRKLFFEGPGDAATISFFVHTLTFFILVVFVNWNGSNEYPTILLFLLWLTSTSLTTALPSLIWLCRRLRRAPAMRQKWDAQGGWKLGGTSRFDCVDTYFADACRELFDDLRARVGMQPSPAFWLRLRTVNDLEDEYVALRQHVAYEPRFLATRDDIETIVREIHDVLAAMYSRMRTATFMMPNDVLDLEARDRRRLNELYTEFCETTRVRIEHDPPATKGVAQEAVPTQREATFERAPVLQRKT